MIKKYLINNNNKIGKDYIVDSVNVILFKLFNIKITKELKEGKDYLCENDIIKVKDRYKNKELEIIFFKLKKRKRNKNE